MEIGWKEIYVLHVFVSFIKHLSLSPFFITAFEITIDHPHTHVVKCTQLVRGEHQLFNFDQFCLDFV